MIDIDERYETLYEQWDVAGQPMGSFAMFIFAEYEKTFAEVKRLREAIKVATMDLEEPNMHEETRKDLLDVLKELIE